MMSEYEEKLKVLSEDFVRKDVVVECLYSSGGEICQGPSCHLFGNCWIGPRPLEDIIKSSPVRSRVGIASNPYQLQCEIRKGDYYV